MKEAIEEESVKQSTADSILKNTMEIIAVDGSHGSDVVTAGIVDIA